VTAPLPAGPIEVQVPAGGRHLPGQLMLPPGAAGLVVFAHGSGSSRFSARNQAVAAALQQGSLATLLFDLLSAEEERIDRRDRSLRFDIPLLAERVVAAIDWARQEPALAALPIGLFGASTGAAAALIGAADRPDRVQAVVSRGGRPDLALEALGRVRCPVLLLVGGADVDVLELNSWAAARLQAPHSLVVIPGAGHLFEEPGSLEDVAIQARDWFAQNLTERRC
jgi:pimeloyl-ACP methyl ester carboxylesterase